MAHYHGYMHDLDRRFQSMSLTDRGGAATYFDRIIGNYFDSVLPFSTSPDVTPARLQSCFQYISRIYRSSLRGTGTRPDWSDAGNRRAYIHRFFMMHSYMVYQGLQLSLAENKNLEDNWFGKNTLRLCCIGGGPGSDVVGLVRFLRNRRLMPAWRIECSIFDLHHEWVYDWEDIKEANHRDLPVDVTYLFGDLASKRYRLTRAGRNKLQSADIITVVKFYSTVAAFFRMDSSNADGLREMFQAMKVGALVLYIDNWYRGQHEEFREIAQSGGVSECLFEWHGEMNLPSVGHSASINRVSRAIGVEPLQRCRVSILLLQKPARQWRYRRRFYDYG